MANVHERTKYDLEDLFEQRTKLNKHCIVTLFMHWSTTGCSMHL
jgi:hypothetical protein